MLLVVNVALEAGKSTEAWLFGLITTVRHIGEVELCHPNCSMVTVGTLNLFQIENRVALATGSPGSQCVR